MNRPRRAYALAIAAAALLALSGCVSIFPHPTLTAAGSITTPINEDAVLDGTLTTDNGSPCLSDDGYDDISSGAQVIITDAAGKTVGVGYLGHGKVADDGSTCKFSFAIKDITAGSKFYGVHVGNQNRGVVQEKPAELKSIELELGQ